MKAASFYALTLTSILGVAAIESLSEYVGDVPKCAYSAFTESVEKEGCNTKDVNASTFDCICKHMASIVITVVREVDSNCNANFGQALIGICGRWQYESTSATDLPAATSALAAEFAGHTIGTVTGSTVSNSPATTTSKGPAAAATPILNLAGGAAAVVVGMLA